MTFASVSDMQTRYGAQELLLLGDRDGSGALDAGVVEAHLQDADAEIVSELAGSVVIDTVNPPLNLKRLACDIARYRLYGANPPEAVRSNYKDAIAFLQRVRSGQASLDGGALTPQAPVAPPRAAATTSDERIFRRGL